jgi:hypothetical protein
VADFAQKMLPTPKKHLHIAQSISKRETAGSKLMGRPIIDLTCARVLVERTRSEAM